MTDNNLPPENMNKQPLEPATDELGLEEIFDGSNRALSLIEVKQILEAFLFSSNEPLSAEKLAKLAGNVTVQVARGLLNELKDEYQKRGSGLQILEIAGGFQMATREHLAEWVVKLQRQRRRTILSPATLETLSIVAYKQPLTRAEVESIRGVDTSSPLRTLVELGIVEVGGRKEVVGRPPYYITTDKFLQVFGLKSLADLPTIAELKDMFAGQYSWFHQLDSDQTEGPVSPAGKVALEPSLFGLQPVDTFKDEEQSELLDEEPMPGNNNDDLFKAPSPDMPSENKPDGH